MFELIEASFDTVALFVEFAVIGALLLSVTFRWNNRSRADVFRLCHESIGVVATVCDYCLGLLTSEQRLRRRVLTGLSGSNAELER